MPFQSGLALKHSGLPEKKPITNVKNVIAVSSAKGGVGKSTIATNLALTMAQQGLHTGILDTDIYGPSIPTLLNVRISSNCTIVVALLMNLSLKA